MLLNNGDGIIGNRSRNAEHEAVITEAKIGKGLSKGEYWGITNPDDFLGLGRTFEPETGINNIESDSENILNMLVLDINGEILDLINIFPEGELKEQAEEVLLDLSEKICAIRNQIGQNRERLTENVAIKFPLNRSKQIHNVTSKALEKIISLLNKVDFEKIS